MGWGILQTVLGYRTWTQLSKLRRDNHRCWRLKIDRCKNEAKFRTFLALLPVKIMVGGEVGEISGSVNELLPTTELPEYGHPLRGC